MLATLIFVCLLKLSSIQPTQVSTEVMVFVVMNLIVADSSLRHSLSVRKMKEEIINSDDFLSIFS